MVNESILNKRSETILAQNEPAPEVSPQVKSPELKERITIFDFCFLFGAFLMFLLAIAGLNSYSQFTTARKTLNKNTPDEDMIYAIFILPFIKAAIFLGGAVVSLAFSVVGFIQTYRKCRNQTWSNIMRLCWPQAGRFMLWATATLLFSVSSILFIVYIFLLSRHFYIQ